MWIKARLVDGVVCAGFTSPEIRDLDDIQQIGVELMQLIEAASDTKKLLLSFEGIRFMSSAIMGILVLLNKKAKLHGVQLNFCDMGPNILEVFRITRLHGFFRKDDEDDDWKDSDDDQPGPGGSGVFAKLPKRPDFGGSHAIPPRDDEP